jgi:hypothetical protein
MKNLNVLQKIAKAKKEIKETKMKKEGKNTYSNYDYFLPSQIERLVFDVCEIHKLITTFDLKRTELGEMGVLTVVCIETGEFIQTEMATAIPSIKATNLAQQIGGCMTYTERYLKTSLFGIVDNSLDFDDTEATKQTVKNNIVWLTEEQFNKAMKSDTKGITNTIKAFSKTDKKMSSDYKKKLEAQLKKLQENK